MRYFHGLISSSLGQMLAELRAAAPGERVSFPDTLIIAAMVNPTLDVATTHEELEMSASISSIESHELRAAIVDLPTVVRDAVATEEIATR